MAYGRQWVDNPTVPARGEDGSIVFVFGSTLPTVVCAPLYRSADHIIVGRDVHMSLRSAGLM